MEAMKFWVSHGIVTGSGYNAKVYSRIHSSKVNYIFSFQQGCKPYPFPPCDHHINNTDFLQCDKVPEHGYPPCYKVKRERLKS